MMEEKEKHEAFELAFDILGFGIIDLDSLNRYVEAGRKFDYDFLNNALERLEDLGYTEFKFGDMTEINKIFLVVLEELFYILLEEVEQQDDGRLKNKIEDLRNKFSPFINACDSWFNNCFDELDLSRTKEEITKEARSLLNQ
jgi:hypothetical protein